MSRWHATSEYLRDLTDGKVQPVTPVKVIRKATIAGVIYAVDLVNDEGTVYTTISKWDENLGWGVWEGLMADCTVNLVLREDNKRDDMLILEIEVTPSE